MKTIVKLIAVITAVFILAAFISYRVITNYYNREEGMRTVVMNRITSDVEDRLEENCELSPDMIPDLDIYRQEYVKKAIPDEIRIVSINAAPHRIDADASYIQPVFGPSRDSTTALRGFLYFIYSSNNRIFPIEMAGIILIISYFAVTLIILLGYHTMIRPFNRLSEYPEKIAKGRK